MAQGDVLGFIKNRPGNRIINGALDFWQRGISNTITNSSDFTVDRFKDVAIGSTIVAGIARQTDSPDSKSIYANRLTVNTLDTMSGASDVVSIFQNIEGYQIADLFGKRISFGIWVKSNVVGTYSATLSTTAGAGNSYIQEFTIDSVDTWEFKKFENILLDNAFMNGDKTNGIGLALHIMLDMGSNRKTATLDTWAAQSVSAIGSSNQVAFAASASNYFQYTQVIFNEGPVVVPFERAGVSAAEEERLCHRYYWRVQNAEGTLWRGFHAGQCIGTALAEIDVRYPVSMRTIPTLGTSGVDAMGVPNSAGTAVNSSNIVLNSGAGVEAASLGVFRSGSGLTQGHACTPYVKDNEWIDFDAEL